MRCKCNLTIQQMILYLVTHVPATNKQLMKQALLALLPGFVRRRIERSDALQRVLGNVSWLLLDKLLRLGVGLIVTAWIARYLGPEQFGIWSYALSFAALFGTFATLGLDGIVVRELVKDPASRDEILGSAFILKLVGGLIALAMSAGLFALLKPEDTLSFYLIILAAGIFVLQSLDAVDLYFQAHVQSKYSVIARDTAFVLLSLGRVALILSGATLIVFAGAGLAEAVLAAVLLVLAFRIRGESVFRWRANLRTARSLLRDSWPLILSGLVIMVYMRIDQIMIGEMIGKAAVGTYAAAVRISEIWYFVPVAIAGSVYPAIVELRHSNPERYRLRMQQLYDMLTWLSIGAGIIISLLSGFIIHLLYGEEFRDAAGILIVHVWTGVFVSLGVASGKHLLAENLTKIAFYRSLCGALVNVGLNFVLIPQYGAIGAAFATLISQALATYIFDFTNAATRTMFMMKTQSLFFVNALTPRRGADDH